MANHWYEAGETRIINKPNQADFMQAQILNDKQRSEQIGFLLGIIAVIIFAGSLPCTHIALASFSPLFITFGRAAIATIAALIIIAALKKPFPGAHWREILIAGLLLGVAFPALMAVAMQTLPSSHGGVVMGILPLMTATFASLIDGDRPSPLFWFCAIGGGVLVIAFATRNTGISISSGDMWLLAACACCSLGYVFSGKLSRHMPGWEVISWALIAISPISFIGTALVWEPRFMAATMPAIYSLFYLGLFSMYIGFFAWNIGLGMGGIARVGQVQLLQTFVTLGLSALLLGEYIDWDTIIFAVAVAIMVAVGRRSPILKRAQ